ncbi:MAG: sugar transferase [Ignavibacteriaceae bacterium]
MDKFYLRQSIAKYKYFFALFDLFLYVAIILFIASLFQLHSIVGQDYYSVMGNNSLWLLIFLFPAFNFVISFNNLYNINVILHRSLHMIVVIKSLCYFLPMFFLFSLIVLDLKILSLAVFTIIFVIIYLPVFYVFRVELLRRMYLSLKQNRFKTNVLIVGDGSSGKVLAAKLSFENPFGIKIVGFIDDKVNKGEEIINGKKVLGNFNEINAIIENYKIDEVIIAEEDCEYDQLLDVLSICKKTKKQVKITSNLFNIIPQKMFTEKYADIPVVDVSPGFNSQFVQKLKSVFDRIMALLGLIIISPSLMIISLLIKLSSRGPVLYMQERIGKEGKSFMFYKFRTMKTIENDDDVERKEKMLKFMNGSGINGENKKVCNSKRITKIGKFLRKTSLDELPQLFNVLKGEMSLVGPRPCLPYEYENLDNWQKRRFAVLPGCTGVWQVNGRSQVSFKESVVMDLYYINNLSPWLDLQLLVKTIPVMVFGRSGD